MIKDFKISIVKDLIHYDGTDREMWLFLQIMTTIVNDNIILQHTNFRNFI